MQIVEFEIPGVPQGQRRPRAFNKGKHAGIYKPTADRVAEHSVAAYYLAAEERPAEPWRGPVAIEVVALFAPPKSWPKWKWARIGEIAYYTKPDADNILKLVMDGLGGIAYHGDQCVYRAAVSKAYTQYHPRTQVTIYFEEGATKDG